MASEIHIRPRSRRDTVATVTTVSSLPPPIPPQHQQQQQQHGPSPPSPTHLSASPWTVAYSTLPMWRNKRNVKISYSPLPPSPLATSPYKNNPSPKRQQEVKKEEQETHLSDLVTYQSLTSKKVHSVRGVDKPTPPPSSPSPSSSSPPPKKSRLHFLLSCSRRRPKKPPTPNAWTYTWRGSTYLKPFTSQWEILGYGSVSVERVKHDWLLTYFSETLFTPAGVDICFRRCSQGKNGENESGDGVVVRMGDLPEQLVSEIRRKLQDSEDETLKKLGGEIFRVKVD